jgi:hypothetical protein
MITTGNYGEKKMKMKDRLIAIIVLLLFILLLANIFVFRIMEEISVFVYVIIIAGFLIFYNKPKDS